jgi:hypothetical protein
MFYKVYNRARDTVLREDLTHRCCTERSVTERKDVS